MSLAFSQSSRQNVAQEQDREHILQVLQSENEVVSLAVKELYEVEGENKDASVVYCKRIIASIDKIIAAGDWQASLFLRNVLKPLLEIQQDAKRILQNLTQAAPTVEAVKQEIQTHQQLIYISLYNAKGHDLASWVPQLKSIDSYVVGRPVYLQEANVKKAVRLKAQQTNEAYIVMLVDKNALQTPNAFEVDRKDRYGNSLESLKVGAVDASHIVEFVHDGVHYTFEQDKLVPLTPVEMDESAAG